MDHVVQFDQFHELIMGQEVIRINARGYHDGLGGGTYIGLPPVINFGRGEIRDRVVNEVLEGKKNVCLAISEAFAGSDVAGLKCTAVKSADGKYWTVNGTKKWITNGTFADYFTVGCRTDKGLVVLLIERGEGVETKKITTSCSAAAGTAFITFDNVKVPYEHTLGPDNGGLQVILSNFNHERWGMVCANVSSQRVVVEECLK
jgi:alkylation response protein AidB-like acyl-CoA dehydrogenase